MKEKKVVDIMLRVDEYPIVSKGTKLQEAWKAMGEFYKICRELPLNDYRMIMVKDENDTLVGMITFEIFLETFDPHFLNTAKKITGFLDSQSIFSCILSQPGLNVEEIMLPLESISLRDGETVASVLKYVDRSDVSAFPVLDESGVFKGLLNRLSALQNLGLGSDFVKLGLGT